MTDKVQKIREEVARLQKRAEHNFDISLTGDERQFWLGESNVLTLIGKYIDTMQEEPVSEDLEYAAKDYSNNLDNICGSIGEQTRNAFKVGAKWKEQQLLSKTIDAHCFGFQGAALFSFRLPADNYLVGSEVKIIVIKED